MGQQNHINIKCTIVVKECGAEVPWHSSLSCLSLLLSLPSLLFNTDLLSQSLPWLLFCHPPFKLFRSHLSPHFDPSISSMRDQKEEEKRKKKRGTEKSKVRDFSPPLTLYLLSWRRRNRKKEWVALSLLSFLFSVSFCVVVKVTFIPSSLHFFLYSKRQWNVALIIYKLTRHLIHNAPLMQQQKGRMWEKRRQGKRVTRREETRITRVTSWNQMKWSEQLTLSLQETKDFTRIDCFRFYPTDLLTFDDFPLLCPDKDKTSWDCLDLHLLTPDFLKKPSLFSPNWPTNRTIKGDTFMLKKTMCCLKGSESDKHL